MDLHKIDCVLVSIQDNIFRLGSSNFENGRGKSPYDPKLLTASMLIGECVRQCEAKVRDAENHVWTGKKEIIIPIITEILKFMYHFHLNLSLKLC